jgi:hypothetical protein
VIYWQRRGKYNAKSTWYNGYIYASKREAGYAAELDLRIKAKEVERWERQVKISLDIGDYHICNYYVDFKVYLTNGDIELVEVKGMETEVWRLKRKLLEAVYLPAHPEEKYVVVK